MAFALAKLDQNIQLCAKYDATSGYQYLLLKTELSILYNLNSTPPLPESKPRHKGDRQGCIAFGNTYPLQAPNENLHKPPPSTTNALHSES